MQILQRSKPVGFLNWIKFHRIIYVNARGKLEGRWGGVFMELPSPLTHSLSHQWETNSLCLLCWLRSEPVRIHHTPKHMSSCHKFEPNKPGWAENRQRKCTHVSPSSLTMEAEKRAQHTGPWPTCDHGQIGWGADPWSVLEDPVLPAALLLPASPGGRQT